jgi:hypothetical protein
MDKPDLQGEVRHSKILFRVFGEHLMFMNIPPRKEEGSYSCFLRVGEKLGRYDMHPTFKELV